VKLANAPFPDVDGAPSEPPTPSRGVTVGEEPRFVRAIVNFQERLSLPLVLRPGVPHLPIIEFGPNDFAFARS
jgi:cold shock protein